VDALCEIKEMFYSFKQGKHTSLQRYYELFLGQFEVIEQVRVTIPDESLMESIAASNGRAGAPKAANWATTREQALAIRFIRGMNDNHKTYLTHLRNSYLDGSNYYPTTLHEAYHILQHHEPKGRHVPLGSEQPELVFINASGGQPRDNLQGCGGDRIICFECGQPGHIASKNCPN
jgi:hypothetical protein